MHARAKGKSGFAWGKHPEQSAPVQYMKKADTLISQHAKFLPPLATL